MMKTFSIKGPPVCLKFWNVLIFISPGFCGSRDMWWILCFKTYNIVLFLYLSWNHSNYKPSWLIPTHSPFTRTASDPEQMPLLVGRTFLIRRFPMQVCMPLFELFIYCLSYWFKEILHVHTWTSVSTWHDLWTASWQGSRHQPPLPYYLLEASFFSGPISALRSLEGFCSRCLLSGVKLSATDITTMRISGFSCCCDKNLWQTQLEKQRGFGFVV